MTESYTLVLAKEDFKFSCAHFTLFGPDTAEPLHGHNYQVQVELTGNQLDDDGLGLLAGIAEVKAAVRASCGRLDDRILIPLESPYLEVESGEGSVEVRFQDRVYRFPAADAVLLPLANTSIELLARYLWHELAPVVADSHLESLAVNVGETAGQSCWYRAPLVAPSK